ncbi:DNA methyltransferase [Microbacterium caowuchunii]|uniref:DNA modification methylase n=1 Tax=Microbacterium caowuchunii TaxID=2614638 RepID=A0A5N0TGP2_9MICO|nr:DNA methyltransferase [Microbacterium caowuchunii]KAA9133751.1 DNA modification methylase [Microbacterium caowuchunii]
MSLELSSLPLDDLTPYYKNPRKGNVDVIADSLRTRGQYKPIVVNAGTFTGRRNEILAGNHTYLAARALSWDRIDVVTVDVSEEEAAQIVLADNRIADLGDYDDDLLRDVLGDAGDLTGTGYTDEDLERMFAEPAEPTEKSSLASEFGAPPLTVLSSRAGEWQERKKAWMDAGLRSEAGRDEALVYDSPQARFINWYKVKNAAEEAAGRSLSDDEVIRNHKEQLRDIGGGTSVFDPALAEVILSWYSAPGSRVIDPWAGGAVRGVVSAALGREYVGVELRPEQIEANRDMMPVVRDAVAARLGDGDGTADWVAGTVGDALGDLPDESFDLAFSEAPAFPAEARVEEGAPDSRPRWVDPEWIEGDSTRRLATIEGESFDMALGCPPYYDLESYSDDPRDLSNLTPKEFDAAMARTIKQVARVLRDDSFAVFVVGAVRDKKGHILDMRRCMSEACEAAGMALVNDAVLLTPVGSAAMRAARGFRSTRTLARVHQEVLVYVKGSRKKAADRLGPVSFAAVREAEGDVE